MIRHVVMFRWKDGVDAGHVEATAAALSRLPALIPQIVSYAYGPDLGIAPVNFDFAVTAQFASRADFEAYRDHPDHQAFVGAFIAPFAADRFAVQFEEPGPA
ncbi:MAG: hypothetical protein RJA49_776 [Actinomycetota bacterium]|jgi:hypothetical protein